MPSSFLFQRGPVTYLELSGSQRAQFVHRLCTNVIDTLRPGQGQEAFVTDPRGHVLAHVLALATEETLVLRAEAGRGAALLAHFDHYIIRDDVGLHDRSSAICEFVLGGPGGSAVWHKAVGESAPPERLGHAALPAKLAAGRVVRWDAETLLVEVAPDAAAAVAAQLQAAGATPIDSATWEAWRIEKGWPLEGRDFNRDNLPQEIGRDAQAISFNKGCYLGQETVARLDARGHVNRRLRRLRFSTAEVPPPGTQLTHADQPAGVVTSAAWAPELGRAVALGLIRRGHDEPGTVLNWARGEAEVSKNDE